MSTLLSVESDGAPIQFDPSFWQSVFVPFWDGSWAASVSTPSYSFHSNSFVTPHPFICRGSSHSSSHFPFSCLPVFHVFRSSNFSHPSLFSELRYFMAFHHSSDSANCFTPV